MRSQARPSAALACVALLLASCGSCEEDDAAPAGQAQGADETADRPVFDDPDLPGVGRADEALTEELRQAARERGVDGGDELRWVNRLARERSPYLLEHADNPVNWFPWGEEARERARQEDKPILLSIGYAACHWCHVMEAESFTDPDIARLINEHFIPVKVDREERPDVDEIYVRAVSMIAGHAGWPLTVALTPDGEPFFGGTYFPPRGQHGLATILSELAERYATEREGVVDQAGALSRRLRVSAEPSLPGDVPGPEVVRQAARAILGAHDANNGGFGRQPKFPQPSALELVLRYHRRTDDPLALGALRTTLDHMAAGGIHDQLGGGFHRYTVDARWLVPHFEKMLYDNAQLAEVYVEAWQVTGREEYAEIARETLAFVDRELSADSGGFAASLSADSESPAGEMQEGRYYTWTPDELERVLGPERAAIARAWYGVSEGGQVEGRSVLHVARPTDLVASELRMSPDRLRAELDGIRADLLEARSARPRPPRDDKVIAAWNGLAISAFARASLALGDRSLAERAGRAAEHVLGDMRTDDGHLVRSTVGGEGDSPAVLSDYAFVVRGLLDLYEATGTARWLREAIALTTVMDTSLADEDGGWFQTSDTNGPLLVRVRPHDDEAVPSGNAIAIEDHLRLADFTGDGSHREAAERAFGVFAGALSTQGPRMARMASALERYHDVPREIAIVGAGPGADRLRNTVGATFVPNRALAIVDEPSATGRTALIPWLGDKRPRAGRATAYVCEHGRCELPTTNASVLGRQLRETRPLLPADDGVDAPAN